MVLVFLSKTKHRSMWKWYGMNICKSNMGLYLMLFLLRVDPLKWMNMTNFDLLISMQPMGCGLLVCALVSSNGMLWHADFGWICTPNFCNINIWMVGWGGRGVYFMHLDPYSALGIYCTLKKSPQRGCWHHPQCIKSQSIKFNGTQMSVWVQIQCIATSAITAFQFTYCRVGKSQALEPILALQTSLFSPVGSV